MWLATLRPAIRRLTRPISTAPAAAVIKAIFHWFVQMKIMLIMKVMPISTVTFIDRPPRPVVCGGRPMVYVLISWALAMIFSFRGYRWPYRRTCPGCPSAPTESLETTEALLTRWPAPCIPRCTRETRFAPPPRLAGCGVCVGEVWRVFACPAPVLVGCAPALRPPGEAGLLDAPLVSGALPAPVDAAEVLLAPEPLGDGDGVDGGDGVPPLLGPPSGRPPVPVAAPPVFPPPEPRPAPVAPPPTAPRTPRATA